MKPVAKAGIVAGGYIAAFAMAWLVVAAYIASTSGPDRQLYGAMFAFGDSLLFLGVFVAGAIPATGALFFFLRPYPRVWTAFSLLGLVSATTSIAALLLLNSLPSATLRILVAPLFAMPLLLSAVFAPARSVRIRLIAYAVIEISVFVYVIASWLVGTP